ncbi:hypothetical protein [Allosphingosinicella sp.]|jgi:hypothetical protein|uniref:hypothetical protein n=1 Tax=Allosphingosinicella sp. TaxID=2823234 RepID=UPI002EE59232
MANRKGSGARPGPERRRLRDGKDGKQLVSLGSHRITEEDEELFLDHLAASCNVTWAAGQIGFSTVALYKRRRNDPDFAERWDRAVAQGLARIDALLIRRAEEALEGRIPDPESPIPVMTVQDAIAILKLHRDQPGGGEGRRPAWPARPRSLDETRSSILTKLSAIARNRGLL